MRELLEYLARALVDEPDSVSVEQFEEDDGTIVLELAVAEDDYGKIIGRGELGRVARLVPLPSCEALEVRGGGEEFLVPLVRDAVRSVDVAARLIDVDVAFLGDTAPAFA